MEDFIKTLSISSTLFVLLFSLNVLACNDNFNGKFIDQNANGNILEIKVLDCSPLLELNFPAENRKGHIIADNLNRIIWNRSGRTITEKATLQNDILTINIIDSDTDGTYFQNQIYKLTSTGIEFSIEIFNLSKSYNYKKSVFYIRDVDQNDFIH